jgi:putative NIF3 family GTP cyclohydrolase 1 type 2
MDRRKFLQENLFGATAISSLGSTAVSYLCTGEKAREEDLPSDTIRTSSGLTVKDVHEHLLGLGSKWVDPQKTVDTLKAGTPQLLVKAIAVGWMSYFDSLRQAKERGCNLFVTHEPTYYDHFDRVQSVSAFAIAGKKRKFIEQSGMAILRCHDVWDRVPAIGIRDAWARFLGLEKEIDARISADQSPGRPFCGLYEIAPVTAGEFARQLADKLAVLGQNTVLFLGPEGKRIQKVAVGTGAITPFREMVLDLKADLVVCTDDGFCFWRDGSLAIDMEFPVIIVNHGCSEEIGVKRLAEHLAEKFRPVPVHHISQKCRYRWIRSLS